MATNIKTRVLLPRGTVDSLSSRVFLVGELVMVNTESGFKTIEITAAGTGLSGEGAAEYKELELSATQVKLSSGTTVQSALDSINVEKLNSLSTYAEISAQLSADGYAIVGVNGDLSTGNTIYSAKKYAEVKATEAETSAKNYTNAEIAKLSVEDSAVTKQFVTSVSETGGKISVSRAQPVIADISGLQDALNTKSGVIISADSLTGEVSDLSIYKVTPEQYAAALTGAGIPDNALYIVEASALNAYGQKIENVAPGTISSDAATFGQLSALSTQLTGDYATTTYVNSVSSALSTDYVNKISAVNNKLSDYYLKTETSSKTEISNALTGITDSLTSYVEKSALSIAYDSNNKKIYLSGGTAVSEIDATDFIKDGMLSTVTYDSTTKNIILTFNTDSGITPISVDVSDLVDTYTAGDTSTIDMAVSNNEFTANIINGSITPDLLSATADWIFDCNV